MQQQIIITLTIDEFKNIISEAVRSELQKFGESINPTKQPEYMTRKEVAKKLKVSLVTLNDWTKKGIVPAYKIASRVRYKKSEVEELTSDITKCAITKPVEITL